MPRTKPTCIYVLPQAFADFKKLFQTFSCLWIGLTAHVSCKLFRQPADFGITQLPVQEKKLQVVKDHSDEIKLLVPHAHRLASYEQVDPKDLIGELLLLQKQARRERD